MIAGAPAWMWVLAVLLLLVPVADLLGGLPPDHPVMLGLIDARTALEGVVMLWAAGRPDLSRRSRAALSVPAMGCLVAATVGAATVLGQLTGWFAVSPLVDIIVTLVSYLLTLFLLFLPMAPVLRSEWGTFSLDTLVSVGGLGALAWVLITQPLQGTVSPDPPLLMVYGIAQISHVAVLNLLVLRGLGVPSRRAVWGLIAAEASYLPVLMLAQYQEAGILRSTVVINLFYFGGEIPRLFAALAFRRDEPEGAPQRLLSMFSTVNPFLLSAPLLVGVALLVAIVYDVTLQVPPLAVLLVMLVTMLVGRILLSAREHDRLLRAEAGEAARLHQAKNAAVGRLAGGVAHEFNNLMQIVIGHADLASLDAGPLSPLQRDLSTIRGAGERAATLTGQLLRFAGRPTGARRPIDLASTIRQLDAIRATLGPQVPLDLAISPVPLTVADPAQIRQMLLELAANAREAMPAGGRFRIEVREDVLREALPTAVLRVPAGRYVVIDASDTGPGIPAADVPHVFEPFFTTKPASQGPGLGLAAVYGIVAAHEGGIRLESSPGTGTRFRFYFPVVDAAGAA